ncbi:MAG: hypothetical protein ACHQNA_00670, partial [Acidimicrobiales bacterium]
LSEALSAELAPHGVQVSMIKPGPVATSFFETRGHLPVGRLPRPLPTRVVADAVLEVVDRNIPERFLPRWLGVAYALRVIYPPLYRWGIRRRVRRDPPPGLAEFYDAGGEPHS